MRTTQVVWVLGALLAAMPAMAQQKKTDAAGQARQADQSGRAFDGNPSGRSNSTLNTGDAVVAKPPSGTGRTPEQAAREYQQSGRANPTPQTFRRQSPPPPPPTPAPKK